MSNVETKRAMVRVPPGTWTVDPIHSSVGFKIKHMMIATVRGQFNEFEGTIVAAEDDPANSHAMGTVKDPAHRGFRLLEQTRSPT